MSTQDVSQACRILNGKYAEFGYFEKDWPYFATLKSKARIQNDISNNRLLGLRGLGWYEVKTTATPYSGSVDLEWLIDQWYALANACHPDGIYPKNDGDVELALLSTIFGDLFPSVNNKRISDKFKNRFYPRSFKNDATREEELVEVFIFLCHFHTRRRFFICGQQGLFGVGPAETEVEMWSVSYLEAEFLMS